MDKTKAIITIGRETGSGGIVIGKKIAERLNVPFYDRELLTRAAKESGMDENVFKNHDEQPSRSLLYSLAMGSYGIGIPTSYNDMPLDHKVFLAQFDTIRKIAEEGPCVIVGRCADYALEEYPYLFSVFILGNEKDKIQRIVEANHLTPEKAKDFIRRCDKRRSAYYDYYANKKWGSAKSYDMCINSSEFGFDGCADLILDAVEKKIISEKTEEKDS